LFRSEQFSVVENGCREFAFVSEFFMFRDGEAQEMFSQITGKAFNLLLRNLEGNVGESYDSISLFLCVRLTHKFRAICRRKGVAAMERYWDSVSTVLWPRLRAVVQMNTQSIRDCEPGKLKAVVDQRPHYVSCSSSRRTKLNVQSYGALIRYILCR